MTTALRPDGALDATGAVLTVRDFAALERFARLRLLPDDPAARALLGKLDGSRIVRVNAVDPDVATLGSRRCLRRGRWPAGGAGPRSPDAARRSGLERSPVTAPQGLACSAVQPGDVVAATRRDGAAERLYLLDVLHQPEAVMRDEGGRPRRSIAAAARGAAAAGTGGNRPPTRRPVLYRSLARTWPVAPRRPKDGSIGGW